MTATTAKKNSATTFSGIGDGEGVERRQEEEVVGQHADEAGEQRRPQAVNHRADQDRSQEHQRDVGDAEHLVQHERNAE